MDYILIGILVISLALSISIIFQSKNYQQHMKEEKAKLQSDFLHLGDTIERIEVEHQKKLSEALQNLSELYEKRVDEKFAELQTTLEYQIDKISTKVEDTIESYLHSYLIQEEEEIQEWIYLIKEEKNHARAIQQLESALNKFPGSGDLIQEYTNRITPFLKSSEPSIQKLALERYNRATRAFLDNCLPEFWDEAKELHNNALTNGNIYMKSQVKQFKDQAEAIIHKLEGLVTNKPLTEQQMLEIEVLDGQLQKEVLKNFKDLSDRYNKVTQRLFKQMSPELDALEIQAYNLNAVKHINNAQDLFANNESHYKNGNDLENLTNLLGSWDSNYLTPATQMYFQTVYSDIFTKLIPAIKPRMTELMLKVDKRKVSA